MSKCKNCYILDKKYFEKRFSTPLLLTKSMIQYTLRKKKGLSKNPRLRHKVITKIANKTKGILQFLHNDITFLLYCTK